MISQAARRDPKIRVHKESKRPMNVVGNDDDAERDGVRAQENILTGQNVSDGGGERAAEVVRIQAEQLDVVVVFQTLQKRKHAGGDVAASLAALTASKRRGG